MCIRDSYSNRLTGAIPTQIGRLSHLHETFLLHSNDLSGLLPSQLGRLSTVRQLFAFDNSIAGTVPSEIGMLAHLTQLHLQSNRLQGSLPSQIGAVGGGVGINRATLRPQKLPLHDLVISDNRLDSELPRSLCNQTALRHFSASNNRFSGRVPPCRFPNVEVFDVASNRLTGPLPRVEGWGQVSYLLLHENSFTGGVTSLALNGSVLSAGKQPDPYTDDYFYPFQSYLGGNLVGLTLHQNRLDEALPEDLALPPSLEYFTISNNLIPGRVPRRLLSLLNSSRGHAAWEPSGYFRDDDDRGLWHVTSGYVHVAGNRTTLLLSNNRLSCNLPASWMLRLDKSSLVLVGNLSLIHI